MKPVTEHRRRPAAMVELRPSRGNRIVAGSLLGLCLWSTIPPCIGLPMPQSRLVTFLAAAALSAFFGFLLFALFRIRLRYGDRGILYRPVFGRPRRVRLARIRGYFRPPVRIPVLVVLCHGNGRDRRLVLFDAFPRFRDWLGARFTDFS